MLIPLIVLSVGAVFAGFVFHNFFVEPETAGAFWQGSLAFNEPLMHAMHEVPTWVKWSSTAAMLLGLLVAALMYLRETDAPRQVAENLSPLYKFLLNKWYFDELYTLIFVRPAFWFGRVFWKGGDKGVIDRFGPDGVANVVRSSSGLAVRFQSGYLYSYALVMLLGLVGLVTWVMVR